jgi:2-oxoglutarate dehydrogenase E2 component (dihydrolipoamide succinyltransferase)
MRIDVTIPSVGESITEVEIGEWFKNEGDSVSKNESLLLLETDKATVEVHAPESGTLVEILKHNGESAAIGEVIAELETNGPQQKSEENNTRRSKAGPSHERNVDRPRRASGPATKADDGIDAAPRVPEPEQSPAKEESAAEKFGPSERDIEIISAKEMAAQETQDAEPVVKPAEGLADGARTARKVPEEIADKSPPTGARRDEVVPMTLLRRRIAERLLAAQHGAALLTTFNEIDMSTVIALRRTHGDAFREQHGIKLGFMSFFVKAAVAALQTVREVNAQIDGDNIVYHEYCDIGVAVGGGKGLVVPVLRDAQQMSFADIERAIADFASRARDNRLNPDELRDGTFTITNGGVYGSLLSTPIVNPPQSAILGLHAVQERPVAHAGAVAIRPMMYVALTYDHRLIDGREAVAFLKQIKSLIEEPARMLLELPPA